MNQRMQATSPNKQQVDTHVNNTKNGHENKSSGSGQQGTSNGSSPSKMKLGMHSMAKHSTLADTQSDRSSDTVSTQLIRLKEQNGIQPN